jgi:glycosyltransferase involved in cell wall biosynthesis
MSAGQPAASVAERTGVAEAVLPSASVVVCVYTEERWSKIVRAVGSLTRQRPQATQIVLVVDHNDELAGRLQAELPGVIVVTNKYERGLSGGRNTGIDVATGEVIAFLDDDAYAEPEWLYWLLEPYREEDVMGVGGSVLPDWPGARAPSWLPAEFYWIIGCSWAGLPQARAEVRNPIGANMSFRRSAFQRAGSFKTGIGRDSGFVEPLGCEETEFGIRLRQLMATARLVHEPRAVVRHEIDGSRLSWDYFRARCMAEGRSKARVARLVGITAGLKVEWAYLGRTLVPGAMHELRTFLRRPNRTSVARVGAMVVGVIWALTGYVNEAVRLRLDRSWPGDVE